MKLNFKFPEWEPQYKAALLEVDRAKLLERVAAAEAAIRQRMRAMFGRTDGDAERQAIAEGWIGSLSEERSEMPSALAESSIC
jgi:hypothetical protein